MHSSQGLTPQDSLKTHDLALKPQARLKLIKTHLEAGALYIDEYSQLQCEINNAAALRTTYARENAYNLDKSVYHKPLERYGRAAILVYSGDRLQLPPVPESSGLLASIEKVTNEHAVGASIFRNAELVFQFHTAMRFTDARQVQILEVMRTPVGSLCQSNCGKRWRQLNSVLHSLIYNQDGIIPAIAGASLQWLQCSWRANRLYGIGDL